MSHQRARRFDLGLGQDLGRAARRLWVVLELADGEPAGQQAQAAVSKRDRTGHVQARRGGAGAGAGLHAPPGPRGVAEAVNELAKNHHRVQRIAVVILCDSPADATTRPDHTHVSAVLLPWVRPNSGRSSSERTTQSRGRRETRARSRGHPRARTAPTPGPGTHTSSKTPPLTSAAPPPPPSP